MHDTTSDTAPLPGTPELIVYFESSSRARESLSLSKYLGGGFPVVVYRTGGKNGMFFPLCNWWIIFCHSFYCPVPGP
jgi:hypothetical protein